MYDELIKRLRESKKEQCYIGCFGNCGCCKIDAELEQAADAIEELSMKRVGTWHRVKATHRSYSFVCNSCGIMYPYLTKCCPFCGVEYIDEEPPKGEHDVDTD